MDEKKKGDGRRGRRRRRHEEREMRQSKDGENNLLGKDKRIPDRDEERKEKERKGEGPGRKGLREDEDEG